MRVDASSTSDSLVTGYFRNHLSLVVGTDTIPQAIIASGEDKDVWWYELQFSADGPIESFTLTNSTLFDQFDDQQNIFQVTHFPSERRQTLYFVRGAETHEVELGGH